MDGLLIVSGGVMAAVAAGVWWIALGLSRAVALQAMTPGADTRGGAAGALVLLVVFLLTGALANLLVGVGARRRRA